MKRSVRSRQHRLSSVFATSLMVAAATIAPAMAGNAATPQRQIMVVGGHGTDFTRGLLDAATRDPSTVPTIKRILSSMIERIHERKPVNIADFTPTAPPGKAEAIGASAVPKLLRLRDAVGSESAVKAKNVDPADDPPIEDPAATDPVDYPVKGVATDANYSWTFPNAQPNTVFWRDIQVCGGLGCTTTDYIAVRLIDNPGAEHSRFDWNVYYHPRGYHFSHIHFEEWALCHGNIKCDTSNSCDFDAADCGYVGSWVNGWGGAKMNNLHIANSFEFWVKISTYYGRGAKTGTAVCAVAPDDNCVYY